MLRLILFCLFILCANGEKEEDLKKIHIKGQGTVIGMKYWDGEFYEFYGIPYATVPTGRDRFKAPLPPKGWTGEMKANRGVLICQQVSKSYQEDKEGDLLFGDEDCLLVSLMVPKIASEKNLVPIIVYVHSGAYAGGNGNMARYFNLAKQDVLVVNFNYRLGALGFACLGTEDIPGNAALKDIVAALKWVKRNAKAFGGDPNKITLAGFSIGASLAEIVALSEETRGLFDKLMLDSGTALTPFAVNRDPINTARNIAISIGYQDNGNIDELNEFLLEADLTNLLSASRNFFLKNSTFGFTPCIENPSNPGAVLIESPLDTIERGDYGDFSLFMGFANMEGISRTSMFDEWRDLMNENLADFLPADLSFTTNIAREEFIRELKQHYFDGKPLTVDSIQGYIDYYSDSMFTYPILKAIKLHGHNLERPVYIYKFTYVGKLNTQHNYMDRIRGASHRDASSYVIDFYDWTRNYTDMDMRNLMTTIWGDYLTLENPTAYESALLKTKWVPYEDEDPKYLDMGYEFVMRKDLFPKSFHMWDKAYSKYYWNPTTVDPKPFRPKNKKATPSKPKENKLDETKPKEAEEPTNNAEKAEEKSKGEKPIKIAEAKPVESKSSAKNTDTKKSEEKSKVANKAEEKPKESVKIAEAKPEQTKSSAKSSDTKKSEDKTKESAKEEVKK